MATGNSGMIVSGDEAGRKGDDAAAQGKQRLRSKAVGSRAGEPSVGLDLGPEGLPSCVKLFDVVSWTSVPLKDHGESMVLKVGRGNVIQEVLSGAHLLPEGVVLVGDELLLWEKSDGALCSDEVRGILHLSPRVDKPLPPPYHRTRNPDLAMCTKRRVAVLNGQLPRGALHQLAAADEAFAWFLVGEDYKMSQEPSFERWWAQAGAYLFDGGAIPHRTTAVRHLRQLKRPKKEEPEGRQAVLEQLMRALAGLKPPAAGEPGGEAGSLEVGARGGSLEAGSLEVGARGGSLEAGSLEVGQWAPNRVLPPGAAQFFSESSTIVRVTKATELQGVGQEVDDGAGTELVCAEVASEYELDKLKTKPSEPEEESESSGAEAELSDSLSPMMESSEGLLSAIKAIEQLRVERDTNKAAAKAQAKKAAAALAVQCKNFQATSATIAKVAHAAEASGASSSRTLEVARQEVAEQQKTKKKAKEPTSP